MQQSLGGDHTIHTHAHGMVSHMDHGTVTDPGMAKVMEDDMRRRFWVACLLSLPVMAYSPVGEYLFGRALPSPIPVDWLLFLLTTPIVFWAGSIFIWGAYGSLKRHKLDMSVLITTGVCAAYAFSVFLTLGPGGETFYEAAALLVTFVLFGHWMEMKSRHGTSEALRALLDLVPPKALVLRDGRLEEIRSSEVRVGDRLVLRPGDRVAVDGEVVEGSTTIDESFVTGESIPVHKETGDRVVGGSINQNGSIHFRATHVGNATVLAQIMKLVAEAQNSKAPGQRLADKAAAILVGVAISGGILTFFAWLLIGQVPVVTALTFAVSVIVIACPDALGLATPTAVAVGTGIGARHNILLKDAATLEQVSRIQAIILDKTGTLTEGKPQVTEILATDGYAEEEVLHLCASIEQRSNHPIGHAIEEEAKKRGIALETDIVGFEAVGGQGVRARIAGQDVIVGTERMMQQAGIGMQAMHTQAERLLANGNTISMVAVDGRLAGIVGIADRIKPSAKKTVTALEKMGLEVAMVTGDHGQVAQAVATQLGIHRVFSQVLPQDKAAYVKKLQQEGKVVAMVGDGINDAPALAQADIGIAIGAGTDVAIETAKVVLMKSDPADILAAIKLSKATVRKMKQNFFWAAIYNILAIPVAAGALYPTFGIGLRPEVSALLMSASSVIVATNAVLLKRVEPELKS